MPTYLGSLVSHCIVTYPLDLPVRALTRATLDALSLLQKTDLPGMIESARQTRRSCESPAEGIDAGACLRSLPY